MPRKLRFLLLFLLLSAAAAAAALVSVFVGGENGDRVRERSGVETGLFSSAAPPFPRAVSGDDEKDLLLRRRRYFSFRSPPFPSLSALSSSSSSSSEIDALAARVAARLEPLLLQQARTSADDGTREREEGSGPRGRSSVASSPAPSRSPASGSSESAFRAFFQAVAGASVASALLLLGERLVRRKKGSAQSHAALLDALRNLDNAEARRLLGQVSLPAWAK